MRIKLREKVFIPLFIALLLLGAVMYSITDSSLRRLSNEFVTQIGLSKVAEIEASMSMATMKALELTSLFTRLDAVQRAYQVALAGDIDNEADPMAQQARQMLRNELFHILQGYETVMGERMKLHFHLPNGRSLVRMWRDQNFRRDGEWVDISDDISGFRQTVMETNRERRIVHGLEIGVGGFDIRSVLPLTSTRGEHLGSVETLVEFEPILQAAAAGDDQHLLLFMNAEFLHIAQRLQNPALHPLIGNQFVQVSGSDQPAINNLISSSLLEQARNQLTVAVSDVFSMTAFPVSDYSGNQIGVMVYVLDISNEQQMIRNLTWVLMGLIGAILLVFAVVGQTTVWAAILKPMRQLLGFTGKVSAGDLQARAVLNSNDEMEDLARAMNTMVQSLQDKILEAEQKTQEAAEAVRLAESSTREAEAARREAVQARREGMLQAADRIDRVVAQIDDSAREMSMHVGAARSGSEQQKMRTGETATSMEQMNVTVLEVAKNASNAAEGSDQAKAKAQAGAEIVQKAVKAIADVQRNALELKKKIASLGDKADGIGRIMNVIDDIADQTNLLALNAAIEAARAGDAGRGFAVVADEVRKLAEKTMAATKEVGDHISSIQTEVRNNAASVDQTVESVKSATQLAAMSGKELQTIVSLSEATSDQVRSIATAAEEQSAASEQITRSVEEIDRISTSNSEAMHSSTQAIDTLNNGLRELNELVEDLKRAD
ncbi:methyl-accepting chemotaxis protein [Desulfonatronum parangueonense]